MKKKKRDGKLVSNQKCYFTRLIEYLWLIISLRAAIDPSKIKCVTIALVEKELPTSLEDELGRGGIRNKAREIEQQMMIQCKGISVKEAMYDDELVLHNHIRNDKTIVLI